MIKYILFLVAFNICNHSIAQERKLVYDVVRNGKVIGEINFVEISQGQKKFLSMNSNVETTVIIPIKDHTAETTGFNKGIMVYSSFYQKQTGSDEVKKTTTISGKKYKATNNGESKLINLPSVRYNTLMLYTNVPANINKVFSGNFQQMLDIKKIAENKYRLMLPEGKVNDYTYKNGICTKVEIVRSMGTVQFVLREEKTGTMINK
ncbi:MAG TPA: DUF6134 family protein [Chitinophagaceae bacterium]|nr:DUF6134 family protein [Chitinophagaceae bacterium]